jgi:hypothetical protein
MYFCLLLPRVLELKKLRELGELGELKELKLIRCKVLRG